jgi:hypothetical protein
LKNVTTLFIFVKLLTHPQSNSLCVFVLFLPHFFFFVRHQKRNSNSIQWVVDKSKKFVSPNAETLILLRNVTSRMLVPKTRFQMQSSLKGLLITNGYVPRQMVRHTHLERGQKQERESAFLNFRLVSPNDFPLNDTQRS